MEIPVPPQAHRQKTPKPATPLSKFLRWSERLIYPIALLTGVIGIVYWYWTTTPSYALAAVAFSVKSHDTVMFEKYVDLDSITGHAFDDLIDGPARPELMGRFDNMIGVGFLRFFKGDIVGIAHERVVGYVANNGVKLGTENNQAPSWMQIPVMLPALSAVTSSPAGATAAVQAGAFSTASSVSEQSKALVTTASGKAGNDEVLVEAPEINDKVKKYLKDYGLSKNGFKGVKYLQTDGNKALFGLEFYSPKLGENWTAEFRMEDAGGYWRITELANLNQLVDKYMQLRDKHLL